MAGLEAEPETPAPRPAALRRPGGDQAGSGARSYVALGQWAAYAPAEVLAALEVRVHPRDGRFVVPHESTIRRTLQACDSERGRVPHIGQAEAMSASVLVQKRGRTTGHTFGRIVGWVPKKEIKNHNGPVHRVTEDFFLIIPRAPISLTGDLAVEWDADQPRRRPARNRRGGRRGFKSSTVV